MMLWLLAPAVQDGGVKELIANKRVTVREITNGSAQIGSPAHDVILIDLDSKSAFFLPKGAQRTGVRRGIAVELNDVAVRPVPNTTQYPLAFPRPGIKKIIDNNRVFVWDYTWTAGKPTPMHFHDKDVVVVYLADGQLKSTTPDGNAVVNTVSFGMTRFNAPNRTHTEELVKGSARAIIVELK